jgi:hypothetical protein
MTLSIENELRAPHVRSGRVFSPSLLRSVFCRLLELPTLPEILELMLLGSGTGSCLLLWAVPPWFVGRPYAHLVRRLLASHDAVPLGLLRRPGEQQYVLAAPSAELLVRADDRIFVLGAHEQPLSPVPPASAPAAVRAGHE